MVGRGAPVDQGSPGPRGHRMGVLWQHLIEPPEGLDTSEQHRARLLLAMVVLLLPMIFVLGLLVAWDPASPLGWDLGLAGLAAAAMVVLALSYALVRGGSYRLGSHVLVGGFWGLIAVELAALASTLSPWTFSYLLLPTFLSSILLTMPATLAIGGGSIGLLLLEWQLGQSSESPETVIYLFTLLTAVALAAHTLQEQNLGRIRDQAQRLHESEQRMQRLLNATFEAVVLHEGRRILDSNPTFQTLFGLPVEAARGQRLDELLAAAEEGAWPSVIEHLEEATTGSVEALGVRSDGRRFQVECRSRPLETAGQGTRVTVLRDISHRKAIEEARANRAHETARRVELEQLVWVTSHALRTPVRTVNSFSQLLARQLGGRLEEDAAESLAYLQGGTAELSRVLDDLRRYGEVATRDTPHLPVPLGPVVEQALENVREELEADGLEAEVHPLPTVEGDPVQLEHLFRELLENPVVHHEGDRLAVEVLAVQAEGNHRIEVRDNGPGIPAELRERALGIFQRLGDGRAGSSTGMGLALARRIAEAHGGRLELTETPGDQGGTTVVVTFPKAAEPASGGNGSPLS